MIDLEKLKREFAGCGCGMEHRLEIRELCVERGAVRRVGEILRRGGFDGRLLLVADDNTLAAARGIESALDGFCLEKLIYPDLRTADMREVEKVERALERADGVLSVGTGSLNDICRLAAARRGRKLALFATAPSMDGFASYSAPITEGCFKTTYPAKTPEAIVADTDILARSPAVLKSAGFGDMMGKYIGLADWRVSHLVTGEYYCGRVADLVMRAVGELTALADTVTACSRDTAEALFNGLLLTGIAMSFTQNSRPGSGTEHILSHFWECRKLERGEQSDFHGRKVAVATLAILGEYKRLARWTAVNVHPERTDWPAVYAACGGFASDVKRLNAPPVTDEIDPRLLQESWPKVREILNGLPEAAELKELMLRAGCPVTPEEVAVSADLYEEGLRFHPYLRHRVSVMRLLPLLEPAAAAPSGAPESVCKNQVKIL